MPKAIRAVLVARILAVLISAILVLAIVLVDGRPTRHETVKAVQVKNGATSDASTQPLFGKTPPPIFPGRMGGYTIKAPKGFPRITNVERMAYDPVTDSLWLAQVVNPKKVVYQVSIATKKAKAAYVIPGGEPTGNRWNGALLAGNDGTIWLGFGSALFRKTSNAKGFVQMRLPPVTGENGQVAGITGMTIRGNELYVARRQRKELLRFNASTSPNAKAWKSNPVATGPGMRARDLYPQVLETMGDGRLFILMGKDSLTLTNCGIYNPSTSEFTPYPWFAGSPFIAGIGKNRIAAVKRMDADEPRSNLEMFAVNTNSLSGDNPFPGVRVTADEGVRSGGFAKDAGRGVVWFFMVDDRTSADEKHAFFVRSSLDGRLTERYPAPLGATFYPMVTDERGNLWAWNESALQMWHVDSMPDIP